MSTIAVWTGFVRSVRHQFTYNMIRLRQTVLGKEIWKPSWKPSTVGTFATKTYCAKQLRYDTTLSDKISVRYRSVTFWQLRYCSPKKVENYCHSNVREHSLLILDLNQLLFLECKAICPTSVLSEFYRIHIMNWFCITLLSNLKQNQTIYFYNGFKFSKSFALAATRLYKVWMKNHSSSEQWDTTNANFNFLFHNQHQRNAFTLGFLVLNTQRYMCNTTVAAARVLLSSCQSYVHKL